MLQSRIRVSTIVSSEDTDVLFALELADWPLSLNWRVSPALSGWTLIPPAPHVYRHVYRHEDDAYERTRDSSLTSCRLSAV